MTNDGIKDFMDAEEKENAKEFKFIQVSSVVLLFFKIAYCYLTGTFGLTNVFPTLRSRYSVILRLYLSLITNVAVNCL
jgi:hypothetical protein